MWACSTVCWPRVPIPDGQAAPTNALLRILPLDKGNLNREKQILTFVIFVLLAALFVWSAGTSIAGPAASPVDDLPPAETPPATETLTPTPTGTAVSSPTAEQTASPTATTAVTETAAAEATLDPDATPVPRLAFLPVLSDMPPPAAGCQPPAHIPGERQATELEMAAVINNYRLNNGLHRLNLIPQLTQAARQHAYDMAENDIFSHTGSDGSIPGERASDACYAWVNVGEIIGANRSVATMFDAWVRSRGNNSLLLAPEFEDFGVGYIFEPGTRYEHYWVVVFGRPESAGLYDDGQFLNSAN